MYLALGYPVHFVSRLLACGNDPRPYRIHETEYDLTILHGHIKLMQIDRGGTHHQGPERRYLSDWLGRRALVSRNYSIMELYYCLIER